MNRLFNKFTLSGFIILVVGFSVGPQVELDETITPVSLTNDINDYIQSRESRFHDIRSNTQKTVVWANPEAPAKTPIAMVYLHGFSATRQEIAPVSDIVAKSLDANLFYTRLTGHGRSSEAMADITVNAFLNDAVEALEIGKRLGDKVILIGTSTGGTLATWLATYDQSNTIAALILVSPNFGPKRRESELLLLPWGNTLLQMIEGPVYQFEALNDLQQQYWTTQYPSQALLPMMGLVKLTREKDFNKILQPVLIIYSPYDNIVSTDAIQDNYSKFASNIKEIITIDETGDPQHHILAGHIMSPGTTQEVANRIIQFIQQIP
ncbi:alpha/beta hydrolase [Kaarinaea lacus]